MDNIIEFDGTNEQHIDIVLKLAKKNKFHHDDIYCILKRHPTPDIMEKYGKYIYGLMKKRLMENDPCPLLGYLIKAVNKEGKTAICGFLLYEPVKVLNNETFIHLQFLLIDINYRDKGIGSSVVLHFLNKMKNTTHKGIDIRINKDDDKVINWYKRFEFVEDKEIDLMRKLLYNINPDYKTLYKFL